MTLTPKGGAKYFGIKTLLIFAYLGRVGGQVVARRCHVNVHVALATGRVAAGAAGAAARGAGPEAEREERPLFLLQWEELLLGAHG